MLKNIIICIFCSVSGILQAQTVIQGQVKDTKGIGINSASVTIKNTEKNTVRGYAFSSETGNYTLKCNNTEPDSISITVSGFNIATKSKRIKNISQTVNFVIEEKELRLKEVTVKQKKVWEQKDTINYLISAFSDKKDFVIGDVLKKMPGIAVDKDGKIFWQGKPINTFYIENMDLLRSRYGIATNNVSANDVATVQVIQHHQPVKALENISQVQTAAINLKLKDEAKGKLTVMGKLGLGASPLFWENELAAMSFSKKGQNISTYKGNNSGVDISGEITQFTTSTGFDGDNLLGIRMPEVPGIDQKRYLFNNSNVVTFNNIFKTEEDADLTVNLAYLNDRESRKSSAITSYYLPGQNNLVILEDMTSDRNTNRLDGGLRYNLNKKEKHIENSLDISGKWDESRGDVISTQPIHQELNKPSLSINDNFCLIKKTSDTKGFTLNSALGFKSTPEELMIYPGIYAGIFNSGSEYSMLKQETRVTNFNSINSFRLLSAFNFGNFSIDPQLSLNAEYRNLNSNILTQNSGGQLIPVFADSMKNNLDWMKYTAKAMATVKYTLNDLDIRVSLPIDYHLLLLNDKIIAGKKTINKLYFQPHVIILYHLGSKSDVTAGYHFNHQPGNIMSYYTGNILSDYRSLSHNDRRLFESQGNGGNIGFEYIDIVNLLSFSSNLAYDHSKRNLLYGQNFKGILSVSSPIDQESSDNGVSIDASVSKGFDWKRMLISLHTNVGTFSSIILQQNQLISFTGKRLFFNGTLSCKPTSFLMLEYKGDWGKSWTKIASPGNTTSYSSLNNNLALDIDLPKDLILNIGFEHYYNSASTLNKNLSFTDLGITYIRKRAHFSLSWNNILNTDNYVTYYYDAINSFQNTYHIRPANIMVKVQLKIL